MKFSLKLKSDFLNAIFNDLLLKFILFEDERSFDTMCGSESCLVRILAEKLGGGAITVSLNATSGSGSALGGDCNFYIRTPAESGGDRCA